MRIDSKYYNVDCTWDGQDAATYNEFLLKSEADFRDHTRESWSVAGSHCLDYTSAEFNAQYPMTEKSWDESTTYAHSEETTSGAVTLKAEWNDPVLGQRPYSMCLQQADQETINSEWMHRAIRAQINGHSNQ